MMLGTSIGVNMLKADPRLWVSVDKNYDGFAFKPNKGWLGYAVAIKCDQHVVITDVKNLYVVAVGE